MSDMLYSIARKALFSMDAESAHEKLLHILQTSANSPLSIAWKKQAINDPVTIAGITFPNRIGLAAGLDKNAKAIDAFSQMGFGFVEVGTVTPLAQEGNPKPRIFRIVEKNAIINRMGFNNEGLEAFINNVKNSQFYKNKNNSTNKMILGLNIGKNAITPIEKAEEDYIKGMIGVYPYADYITINISSPNTKNLRSLQNNDELTKLLSSLKTCQKQLSEQYKKHVPLFLKVAPDLETEQIKSISQILLEQKIEGLIATNTTLSREEVKNCEHGNEAGGLSGAPLLTASNAVIAQFRSLLGEEFPIIGVGGVQTPQDAISKIQAGANLVQIYTGLVYQGPKLINNAAEALKNMNK